MEETQNFRKSYSQKKQLHNRILNYVYSQNFILKEFGGSSINFNTVLLYTTILFIIIFCIFLFMHWSTLLYRYSMVFLQILTFILYYNVIHNKYRAMKVTLSNKFVVLRHILRKKEIIHKKIGITSIKKELVSAYIMVYIFIIFPVIDLAFRALLSNDYSAFIDFLFINIFGYYILDIKLFFKTLKEVK